MVSGTSPIANLVQRLIQGERTEVRQQKQQDMTKSLVESAESQDKVTLSPEAREALSKNMRQESGTVNGDNKQLYQYLLNGKQKRYR